jgi:hypothetical protein
MQRPRASKRALTFSATFSVDLTGHEDWFDPCLVLDSPLCVDPFLMLDLEQEDEFSGAHDEIIAFFRHQYRLVARGGSDLTSPAIKAVVRTMHMPEVSELCLGYSEGTRGAGSGSILARLMVRAMISSVALGLTDVKHFEEFSILDKNIGPDRISDAAACLTKWRFAKYTERVCKEQGISTTKWEVDRARYDLKQSRWVSIQAFVPINPHTGRPVFLTPQRFLRKLPTLGGDEFDKYATREWKERHRDELRQKIISFDKEKVLREARKDQAVRSQFINYATSRGNRSYDFTRDDWGVTTPKAAERYVAAHPFEFTPPRNSKEMKTFVLRLVRYFKHFVEEQGGWELLWNGSRPKPERAVQRLMFGMVFQICVVNNVCVDPEVNAGRGPVDFKFSHGFNAKCLLETKLSSNTKWVRGVTHQLATYIVSDIGRYGVYVLVDHDGSKKDNIHLLEKAASSVAKKGIEIDVVVVDAARDKLSASKL